MPETDVPANAEGGKAAMMTEDEVEHLESAETSVRAAVLGKGDMGISSATWIDPWQGVQLGLTSAHQDVAVMRWKTKLALKTVR